jgi:L-iditol 2-dehydrogenase
VAKAGRVSLFASVPKDNPHLSIDVNAIHYGQIEVYGASDSTAKNHADAVRLLAAGRISTKPLITHILPLDEFFKGIDLIQKREALKVVIKP